MQAGSTWEWITHRAGGPNRLITGEGWTRARAAWAYC